MVLVVQWEKKRQQAVTQLCNSKIETSGIIIQTTYMIEEVSDLPAGCKVGEALLRRWF